MLMIVLMLLVYIVMKNIEFNKYSEIEPRKSGNKEITINHKQVAKYYAVKSIAEKLNVNQEDIIAFDNDYSDIDLFSYCGQGVAMESEIEELKEIANYITKSNDNEEISQFITTKL